MDNFDQEINKFLLAALKRRHLSQLLKLCNCFFEDNLGLSTRIYLTGLLLGRHEYKKKFVLLNRENTREIIHEIEENSVIIKNLNNTKLLKSNLQEVDADIYFPLINEDDPGSLGSYVGFVLGKINSLVVPLEKLQVTCNYLAGHLAAAFTNAIFFHLNNDQIEKLKEMLVKLHFKIKELQEQ